MARGGSLFELLWVDSNYALTSKLCIFNYSKGCSKLLQVHPKSKYELLAPSVAERWL